MPRCQRPGGGALRCMTGTEARRLPAAPRLAGRFPVSGSVFPSPPAPMRNPLMRAVVLVFAALPAIALAQGAQLTPDLLKPIAIRSIGPGLVTGRVADVKIDKKNPSTWYVVAALGGVCKTTNRGTSFTPIFDDGGTSNSCCIEIDPKNSNVLWLGDRKSVV